MANSAILLKSLLFSLIYLYLCQYMNDSKSHTIYISKLEDISSAAKQILDIIDSNRIVLLSGTLGAGKTTLTQQIVAALGHSGSTSSPTYSLVNEYEGDSGPIYHMDLYRLNDIDEAYDIGIEDYLYSGHFCFIEWPEMIMEMIEGEAFVQMNIEEIEKGVRKVEIQVS